MPAEHAELIAEMQDIEKLPTIERLKLARKRRLQQLKKYAEYEKKLDKIEKNVTKKNTKSAGGPAVGGAPPSPVPKRERSTRRLVFADSIVFLDAASRNDVEEVRSLLERGVNPDVANDDGLTALHQCAIDDGVEMAALLLEYGANVNALDSEMWTPLHAAATCGHVGVCQQLVLGGANLLAVNADGNMPYDICEDEATLEYVETEMANMGVTQELIDRTRLCHSQAMLDDLQIVSESGGDLDAKDKNGVVPLHIAAANGYYNVVVYLLEKGVAVDPTDSDGWTPLHAAACWGQMAIVDLLAKFGADLEAKTLRGETVLDICEDPELKHQIEEIKRAVMTSKESQRDPFVQHRSGAHNTRGASIRRHSMRDKQRLSLKEAKEEARLFGADKDDGAVASPDDVEVDATLSERRDADPASPQDVIDGNTKKTSESITKAVAFTQNEEKPHPDAFVGQRLPPPASSLHTDNNYAHDYGTEHRAVVQPSPGTAEPSSQQPKSVLSKSNPSTATVDLVGDNSAERNKSKKSCCSIL